MKIQQLLLASTLALCGCASVTAIPLDASGVAKQCTNPSTKEVENCVQGIRYYMPKPYLLITELPVTPAPAAASPGGGSASHSGSSGSHSGSGSHSSGSGSQSGGSDGSDTADKDDSTPTTNTPSSSTADTSFSASMASYSVKLVYLPDFSEPMALQSNSGLFGTANIGPALQDGWMLTGMSASVDSGGSSILSTAASLVGGKSGGGSGGGGGGGGAAPNKNAAPQSNDLLGDVAQALKGTSIDEKVQAKLLADLKTALASSSTKPNAGPTWGAGVLQPGLYAFRYYTNKDLAVVDGPRSEGEFKGVFPVALFCGNGVVWQGNDTPANPGLVKGIDQNCTSARP
jgi:hypothetical protein